MNASRFFCEQLATGELELNADDSQHASNVLRLQAGDAVELFDGRGSSASGELIEVRKRCVRVEVRAIVEAVGNVADLELFVALPKGDRQKVLVDGLTQLGVRKLTPLLCERAVAQPKDNAIARLRKSVIESCKQCRRNVLMEIGDPVSMKELEHWNQPERKQFVAHPYPTSLSSAAAVRSHIHDAQLRGAPVSVAIGPEGGFTADEVDQFVKSSWSSISLGEQILRIEMAALKVAACLGT
ncbi:MAG: RsmE family RNA methyltransferase [Aureliella sp.]